MCSCLRTSRFPSSRRKTLLLFFHWSRGLSDKEGRVVAEWDLYCLISTNMFPSTESSFCKAAGKKCKWPPPHTHTFQSWIYIYIQMRHHTSHSQIIELDVNGSFEPVQWMKMWNNDKTDQVVTVAGHWFRVCLEFTFILKEHQKWPYHNKCIISQPL